MKKNISNAEYRKDPAYSRSDLFGLKRSPKHFKYALDHPQQETSALIFGTAFHSFVLEPENFAEDYYVITKKIDRRTKEGKSLWAEIESSGKIPIPGEDVQAFGEMRENILSVKAAAVLLKGEKERSYFWTDKLTGVKLKCRPDCRTDLKTTSVIVDLKTTENASTDKFIRSCVNYGYDLQAAMYKQGVETIEGKPHKFVFIAVEKSPPYACNIIEMDESFIKKGETDLRSYLYTLKDCLETNNFYGYNGASGNLNVMGLPAWLAKEYE